MATTMQLGSAETYFAKKLANNEKKVRDRALKRLKSWLSSKGKSENGLNEEDLLKLWKGLFYCMWFSDKPLVQEELADNLADTIHVFKPSSIGVLFSKIFFVTMGREWFGIDRLRLDKFYVLTKKFLKHSLQYISEQNWNENLLEEISTFFKEALLDSKFPVGLKIFVTDNILTLLKEICSNSEEILSDVTFCTLMKPFFLSLAYSNCVNVIRSAKENLMDLLLTIEIVNSKSEQIKIPLDMFANELCQIGAEKDLVTKNRKMIFQYTDTYRQAWNERQIQPKVKKGKRKNKANSQSSDSTEEISTKKKKKKKKNVDIKQDLDEVKEHENEKTTEKLSEVETSSTNGSLEEKVTDTNIMETDKALVTKNIEKSKKKPSQLKNKTNSEKEDKTTEAVNGTQEEQQVTETGKMEIEKSVVTKSNRKSKAKSGEINKDKVLDTKCTSKASNGSSKKSTKKGKKKLLETNNKETNNIQNDANQVEDDVRKVLEFDSLEEAGKNLSNGELTNSVQNPEKVGLPEESIKINMEVSEESKELEQEESKNLSSKNTRKERRATLPAKKPEEDTTVSVVKSKVKRSRKSLPAKPTIPLSQEKPEEKSHVEEPILNLVASDSKKTQSVKKSKKKTLRPEDAPKPFVEFLQTETPKAFARKRVTSAKSEPRKRKEVQSTVKKAPKTPQTDVKKSVTIDISKNKSIGDKELKFSPLPAFNPDVKPTRGVLKTPVRKRKRSKATDFF